MIKINLYCVGNLKEKYFKEAEKEYVKRLSKYCLLNIVEIENESLNKNNEEIVKKEGEKLLKHINDKDYLIILDLKGKEVDSLSFASDISSLTSKGIGNIVFMIGGSLGLSEEIKKRANKSYSFSKLTFPHQLFRIIFLEQLFRSFKINNNETYHR